MKGLEEEKKLAVKEYVKQKNEEDTPTQLKKKNALMKRMLNKLEGYTNQMMAEYTDEEDVLDYLMIIKTEIKETLEKEKEI